jgi:transcriptional regulator with XRE-family HTH domain
MAPELVFATELAPMAGGRAWGLPHVIRAVRKKAGLNQEDFGALTGIHPVTISRIETGEQKPGKKTLRRIAEAFPDSYKEFAGALPSDDPDERTALSGEEVSDMAAREDHDLLLALWRAAAPEAREQALQLLWDASEARRRDVAARRRSGP